MHWGLGSGRLYISQTCSNMLKTYDLASKVSSLVLMLVCIKAVFVLNKSEGELEFVHTNYADHNVVVA